MSEVVNGYSFGGKRAVWLQRRLDYIRRHGARFLFNNEPPPAPGWPRSFLAPPEEQ